ncbi:MAG: HNH endonuclease [Sphingomonadales bacterium]|nr:HNH endonuclease [Sphingomonadaceae bacterium]MBS3930374.1 HNH endonuclease [Sphingomonadales bacterium]
MVDKNGPAPKHNQKIGACWLWTGYRSTNGYGQINRGDHRIDYAHHVAFEIQNGTIDTNLDVMHECDNRPCVRGTHLVQGTRSKNIGDCVVRGRHFSPYRHRTHCKNGHLFTEEKRPDGEGRICRTCINDRARKYRKGRR